MNFYIYKKCCYYLIMKKGNNFNVEVKELKQVIEEYFDLIFVVLKPDFNRFKFTTIINKQMVDFDYKWDNHFDKETNLIKITNLIKDKIILSYIK